MTTAPVIRAAWVDRTPQDAFRIFTDEIGAWWPLPTHGMFGARAGGVCFRDGLLIEQATNGDEAIWAEVTSWDPPNGFTINWHPGRGTDDASVVEVQFEAHEAGTRVVIEHRGWEVFGAAGAERRSDYARPNAWGGVLDHFGDLAEPAPDAAGVGALVAAYADFFAEAERGVFGEAPAGEWDADQTIAHVALNDAAMIAVAQAIVHGEPATFENEISQDLGVLSSWIDAAGSTSELIARARSLSRQAIAVVQRLSAAQLGTEVHCCLSHDGETMLDRPMPWRAVAIETQAAMHLPAHVEQLRNLRDGS